MGFNDLPNVDKAGGNSERSVEKLKTLLNIQSGFILRADVPDFGCDFDVELILDGIHASNQRFPIQLKSAEKIKLIENGEYISYPFETSRLGYLMRRSVGGIIVIYSVERDECFFDYYDRIHNRIMEEKQSHDWHANEYINIHIPFSNKLTAHAAKDLHQTFKNRFDQLAILQNSVGRKYGLPSVMSTNLPKYDFHNVDHVKLFLQEHGLLLLNEYDLHITFGMISRVPMVEIYVNKDLLLIAAVSYCEVGMNTESKLFVSKLYRYQLSAETNVMLRFVEMKNDLALGYLDQDLFIIGLEELLKNDVIHENKITFEINLIHFRLAKKKALEPISTDILSQINGVFVRIDELPPTVRKKELLTLWNCDNLSFYATTIQSDSLGNFQIRESGGQQVSLDERARVAKEMIELETQLNNRLRVINKKAVADSDKLLNAYVFSLDVRHYIFSQINYLSFEIPINKMEGFGKGLLSKIELAAKAYNSFVELDLPNYAYDNLCNLLDLVELAENGYQISTSHDKDQLYAIKEKLESLPQSLNRKLIFPNLMARKQNKKNIPETPGSSFLKDLNDTQIETLARHNLQSMNLPQDRLTHIIHEMKGHRMFHQRCSNPDIELRQEQNPHVETKFLYKEDIRFVLRNKNSGITSLPNSNMDALLTEWGF